MESEGIHAKPFSCTCDLLDRRVQLLLDSSYVDYVGVFVIGRLTMVLVGSLSQIKWRDSLKASRWSKQR
jgi:hypothetical protein